MKCHGYLFGVIRLLEDTHRDEVFVERTGYVIKRNGRSIIDYNGLVAIARSMGVNPWECTLIDYFNDYMELFNDDGIE